MELEQAKQSKKRVENEFAATVAPDGKKLKDRQSELKREQTAGKYAAAKSKLQQLTKEFADAEQGKTFGKSDLDEAYYYRQQGEYKRDKAEEEAREKLEE